VSTTATASSEDAVLGIGLLSGAANVIMELAQPGVVGHGVRESRVESGRTDRDPIKRAITTVTYLAGARHGVPERVLPAEAGDANAMTDARVALLGPFQHWLVNVHSDDTRNA
jgi:uncharacterized protein (DUF2236 family)